MIATKRALVSVSNREGLGEFVGGLVALGYEVFATEGTRTALAKAGVAARAVSDLTGTDELLGGRVKTLHPAIHAAILARRDDPHHMAEIREAGVHPIDLVVVNLYPFAQAAGEPGTSLGDLQEEVDIGGVTLIRAAAKNFQSVAVVVHPAQYARVLQEIRERRNLSRETREELALEAFAYTSGYDGTIYNELWRRLRPQRPIPAALRLVLDDAQALRYGENPYQGATFFRDPSEARPSVASARQVLGRELSYNNILDFNAALELVLRFDRPTAVIIKHTNPSGVASAATVEEAYRRAREGDPRSAFGCVMGFNAPLDLATATAMKGHFVEGIIAPHFQPDALEHLRSKKDLRLLEYHGSATDRPSLQVLGLPGGVLVQTRDHPLVTEGDLRVVTRRRPTDAEVQGLLFAARLLGYVKSNAIVLASGEETVGIGAGQMSRVDSVFLACAKAGSRARGSVMASDAFFPFRDGIDEAARAGVAAVMQPGGSKRDAEVIGAADEHGMAMVFTGVRMFRH